MNILFAFSKRMMLFAFLVIYPVMIFGQDGAQARKDSLRQALNTVKGEEKLRTYARLGALYFAESRDSLKRDTMLTVYGQMDMEAKRQGNAAQQGVARGSILGALLNNQMYDEIIRRTPADLKELAKPDGWKYYYICYNNLIQAYLKAGNPWKAKEEAQQMYNQAKEQQNHEGMAMALYAMADIYDSQGRYGDQEQVLRQCIALIQDDTSLLPITTKIWFNLCQILLMQERYGELPEATQAFEKANDAYEASINQPVATSRGNLWGVYARWYANIGEYDKAEEYCNKIDSLISGARYQAISTSVMATILNARGQYAEALEKINETLALSDIRSNNENDNQKEKAEILRNMGNYREAYDLFEKYDAVKDSLHSVEIARQIDDLRTQYEVDKHIMEKEKQHTYFIFALIGCAILAVLLGIWIYYSRLVAKKNRSLYLQIQELTRAEKKAEENLLNIPEEELSKEMQLFRELNKLIQDEKLFTNPELSRKSLADRIHTNESYLADAIREATGETFSSYISNLRLQYALELLNEHPEMTFDSIAVDSGHGSYSSFFRAFTKKYSITPSEYLKMSQPKIKK